MSKFKLEEVTYSMSGYSPGFKIIDNDIEIEDIEKEDGSIAYLHGIDEDTAKSIVGILEGETSIKDNLEKYLDVLDDDIKQYKPRSVVYGKENAIKVMVLNCVKEDIKQILNGETVEKY